jgi:hypothetical protein
LSGGSSKVDPYYEKAPPKRKRNIPVDPNTLDHKGRKKPLELPPAKTTGPVKEMRLPPGLFDRILKAGWKSKLLWYKCDSCGNLFPLGSQRRRHGKFTFDSPECRKRHRQRLYSGLPPPKTQIESQSRKLKDKYKDPEFRERMRRVHRDPQLNKRRSEAHKRRWEGKRRKRTNLDDQTRGWYTSSDWRRQSKRTLKRDGYTCQGCSKGKRDAKSLGAHHMYPLRKWIEDGNKPEDYPEKWLATVCERCHPATDSQGGLFKRPRAPRKG